MLLDFTGYARECKERLILGRFKRLEHLERLGGLLAYFDPFLNLNSSFALIFKLVLRLLQLLEISPLHYLREWSFHLPRNIKGRLSL